MIVPERSKRVSGGKILHNWHCPVCGNEFETVDGAGAKAVPDDELTEGAFSSLLVA